MPTHVIFIYCHHGHHDLIIYFSGEQVIHFKTNLNDFHVNIVNFNIIFLINLFKTVDDHSLRNGIFHQQIQGSDMLRYQNI